MSALPLRAPADNTQRLPAPTHQASARDRADLRWTLEPELDLTLLDDPVLDRRSAPRGEQVGFVTGDRLLVGAARGGARRALLRVLVTAMAVAIAFFVFFPAGVEADSAPHATTTHVVQSGDTLWSLAAARTPAGSDLRATIATIRDLNDLTGSMLLVGDQIVVPVPSR